MELCHSLVIGWDFWIVSCTLLARFTSNILMRDPFRLSQNTSSVSNDVTIPTFPLNGVFMRTGRIVLIGLTSIWLRVIVVRTNILVWKLTTLDDKPILINVGTSILPLMIPLGSADGRSFAGVLRTLFVLDFVRWDRTRQVPLLYIRNFFTVIKAAAEVLAHHELFIAVREVLFLLTLHHVRSRLLRLCWNAEIALQVWTTIASIMVGFHFDHLSEVGLIERLWNVFGFLNGVGSLGRLLELTIVYHIFLSILISTIRDLRPIAFVRFLGLLPILVLIRLVYLLLLLLLFSHDSRRLLQLFRLLLVGAKAILDGSFLRHYENPIAHIFYFEVSTCLWAYVSILIDSRPQDNTFVERIFYILLIHFFLCS